MESKKQEKSNFRLKSTMMQENLFFLENRIYRMMLFLAAVAPKLILIGKITFSIFDCRNSCNIAMINVECQQADNKLRMDHEILKLFTGKR